MDITRTNFEAPKAETCRDTFIEMDKKKGYKA